MTGGNTSHDTTTEVVIRHQRNVDAANCRTPTLGAGQRFKMTAVGFEPTPLRTGALSQRLRPLGQTVLANAQRANRGCFGRAAPQVDLLCAARCSETAPSQSTAGSIAPARRRRATDSHTRSAAQPCHASPRATRSRPMHCECRAACTGHSASMERVSNAVAGSEPSAMRRRRGHKTRHGTCGLVAMTSASHAEGRQFDPGQLYFSYTSSAHQFTALVPSCLVPM